MAYHASHRASLRKVRISRGGLPSHASTKVPIQVLAGPLSLVGRTESRSVTGTDTGTVTSAVSGVDKSPETGLDAECLALEPKVCGGRAAPIFRHIKVRAQTASQRRFSKRTVKLKESEIPLFRFRPGLVFPFQLRCSCDRPTSPTCVKLGHT